MAAHLRAEGAAAAPELGGARGAVAGVAGALLLVDLLGRAIDLRPVLDRVRAGLALGELPAHATLQDIGARRKAEDGLVELERAGARAVKRADLDLHHAFSSAAGAAASAGAASFPGPRNLPGIGTSAGSLRFTAS